MITQNSNSAPSCVRPQPPVASRHSHPIASTAATALAAWTIVCLAAYGQQATPQPPAPSIVTHSTAADAVKIVIPQAKRRPSIVAKSDTGITIHFDECRENDKGHVSCSFDDPDGNPHWVYLAGVALPGSK